MAGNARDATTLEDFSVLAREAPGVFFFLGITPPSQVLASALGKGPAPGHSPRFFIDEAGLKLGVRALSYLAIDFLNRGK